MRKKHLLVFSIVAAMAFSMCACGGKEDAKTDNNTTAAVEQSADTEAAAQDPDSVLAKSQVVVNGFSFGPGMNFQEIQDKLGQEVKPSTSAMPCDPAARGEIVTHYYDGFLVEENVDHVISIVIVPGEGAANDNVALACGVKAGTDKADVIKVYDIKASDEETEYGYTCQDGDFYTSFVWDDNNKVISISLEDMSVRP